MRALDRNKQPYYYALYTGKSKVAVDGKYTGEYELTYGSTTLAYDNISPSRGTAQDDVFGVELNYTKSIATTVDRGINEYTIIWIFGREIPAIGNNAHAVGDLGLYNGKIYKCTTAYTGEYDKTKWKTVPHTHKVVGVAKSLNSIVYAIRDVDYE